jgi:PAS domain S-box-containing protein
LKPAKEFIYSNVFRAVIDASPDAILVLDGAKRIIFANQTAAELFGYLQEELLLQEFTALVSSFSDSEPFLLPFTLTNGAPSPSREMPFPVTGNHKSGLCLPLELSVSSWNQEEQDFFSCIIRKASPQLKNQQELEFLFDTTEAINQAQDFDSAIGLTIRKVCELTGWEFGEAWIPSHSRNTISYSPQWYAVSEDLAGFARECEKNIVNPGDSLAGRVIMNQVEWHPEVSAIRQGKFVRQTLAHKYNIKPALGVPITAGGEVLAALLFFMHQNKPENLQLTKQVISVAKQLGPVLQRKRIQGQLEESETKYRALFEKSMDPVLLLSNECFIDCNQATVDKLGAKSKEDILMQHPGTLSPKYQPNGKPSLPYSKEMIQWALTKGEHRFEWVHRKFTGEDFWVEVSLTSVSINKEPMLHTTWRDITDRKLAEENLEKEREYLAAVLENVEDGIAGCDEKGFLSFFNRASREFHGQPEIALPPEKWAFYYNLFHADGRTPMEMKEVPLYRALQGEVVRNVEMVITTPTGRSRHVLCSGRKISSRDGKNLGAVLVMHDINDRKEAEEELKQKNMVISQAYEELKAAEKELILSNSELEERVKKRTEELSNKNQELYSKNLELTSMNHDLDNFVYIASHDLKVPLLNMEALLGILRNELVQDNAESQFLFRKFVHAIKRMKQTIQDITEVAKAQRKLTERTEQVYFAAILEEVEASLENLIHSTEAQIHHDFEQEPSLYYSQINLKSIVYNLLANALIYRSPDRTPEIRIRTHSSEGYSVLTVEDNGLGMNLSRGTDKLFAMFTRLHTHVEGSGIGLYIVNRLIENQGGKIEVESQVNHGSTFRIFFRKLTEEN